jgi:hypothetical protein
MNLIHCLYFNCKDFRPHGTEYPLACRVGAQMVHLSVEFSPCYSVSRSFLYSSVRGSERSQACCFPFTSRTSTSLDELSQGTWRSSVPCFIQIRVRKSGHSTVPSIIFSREPAPQRLSQYLWQTEEQYAYNIPLGGAVLALSSTHGIPFITSSTALQISSARSAGMDIPQYNPASRLYGSDKGHRRIIPEIRRLDGFRGQRPIWRYRIMARRPPKLSPKIDRQFQSTSSFGFIECKALDRSRNNHSQNVSIFRIISRPELSGMRRYPGSMLIILPTSSMYV